MGIWTDSNGQSWNINIGGQSLAEMQKNPDFKFCWMKDTPNIEEMNDNNSKNKSDKDNQEWQVTVKCADGSTATGRISHWVNGKTEGSPLKEWFILCTREY